METPLRVATQLARTRACSKLMQYSCKACLIRASCPKHKDDITTLLIHSVSFRVDKLDGVQSISSKDASSTAGHCYTSKPSNAISPASPSPSNSSIIITNTSTIAKDTHQCVVEGKDNSQTSSNQIDFYQCEPSCSNMKHNLVLQRQHEFDDFNYQEMRLVDMSSDRCKAASDACISVEYCDSDSSEDTDSSQSGHRNNQSTKHQHKKLTRIIYEPVPIENYVQPNPSNQLIGITQNDPAKFESRIIFEKNMKTTQIQLQPLSTEGVNDLSRQANVRGSSTRPLPQYSTYDANSLLSILFGFKSQNCFNGLLDCFKPFWTVLSANERKHSSSADNGWEIPFEQIKDLQWLGSGAQGAVFMGLLIQFCYTQNYSLDRFLQENSKTNGLQSKE